MGLKVNVLKIFVNNGKIILHYFLLEKKSDGNVYKLGCSRDRCKFKKREKLSKIWDRKLFDSFLSFLEFKRFSVVHGNQIHGLLPFPCLKLFKKSRLILPPLFPASHFPIHYLNLDRINSMQTKMLCWFKTTCGIPCDIPAALAHWFQFVNYYHARKKCWGKNYGFRVVEDVGTRDGRNGGSSKMPHF